MRKIKVFSVLVVLVMTLTVQANCEKDSLSTIMSSQKIRWNLDLANRGTEKKWTGYSISFLLWSPMSIDSMKVEVKLKRELTWENGKKETIHYILNEKNFKLLNIPYYWESNPNKGYYINEFVSPFFYRNPNPKYGDITEEGKTFSVTGYVIHNGKKYPLEKEEYNPPLQME